MRILAVTDYLPKPLLAVNARGQVTGAAEYNHYGSINRVQYWFMQGFPYTKNASGPVWSAFKQREFGMEVAFRNHFVMVDTEEDCSGAIREGPSIWNAAKTVMYEVVGGYHKGDTWSSWAEPPDAGTGWREMNLGWATLAGNCEPGCTGSCPQPAGQGWSYMGFVHREYEYRRYDTGAKPYFPPLRFPGQYWDEETDLFENWHRNYYSLIGRYLSPEPMLQDPVWVRQHAKEGFSAPTYSYARNNPLMNVDPDGQDSFSVACPMFGPDGEWGVDYPPGTDLCQKCKSETDLAKKRRNPCQKALAEKICKIAARENKGKGSCPEPAQTNSSCSPPDATPG